MKHSCLFLLMAITLDASPQNVGIGTTNPTGPLSFASTVGNKLVLWGDGNAAHYGIGIQSSTLQLYADVANSNIAIGYGRSGSFTERARFYNSGLEGMFLNGRLHLRNGNPANLGGGGGIWLYKPDNSAAIGFMGTQNDKNIGFYGGANLWGFTYDINTSNVGIGNNNPNAPLAFGATLGKKITLYPGTLGDAGFGMAGNRLQIYGDNPNADVAIGYDAAGVFNERFAVKPTGALAVVGQTGLPGQVITSNGTNAAAWEYPVRSDARTASGSIYFTSGTKLELPSLEMQAVVPPGRNARLLVSAFITAGTEGCFGIGCTARGFLELEVNGTYIATAMFDANANSFQDAHFANVPVDVGPGTHTLKFFVRKYNSNVNPINVFPKYSSCLILSR